MGLDATSLGSLVVQIKGDGTEYFKTLVEIQGESASFADGLVKTFEYAAAGAIAAIAAIGVESVKKYGDFEAALVNSTANMTGATEEMRQKMADTALQLSKEGVSSAEELAVAYGALRDNGMDAAQSVGAIAVAEKYATASGNDLVSSTNQLAKATVAVGLASADATKNMQGLTQVSNVITTAARLGNSTMASFASALASSGMQIRQLSGGLTEGAAVIAAYTKQGKDAETAAGNLNLMLRSMQQSAQKQPEVWAAFGLSIYDVQGKLKPMADIMDMLKSAMVGLTPEEQRAELGMLGFQSRTLMATTALMDSGDAIRNFQTALTNAGDATEQVAQKQLATFNAQLKILWNNIVSTLTAIGSQLVPVIELLFNSFKEATKDINGTSDAVVTISGWFKNTLNAAIQATIVAVTGVGLAVEFVVLQTQLLLEVLYKTYQVAVVAFYAIESLITRSATASNNFAISLHKVFSVANDPMVLAMKNTLNAMAATFLTGAKVLTTFEAGMNATIKPVAQLDSNLSSFNSTLETSSVYINKAGDSITKLAGKLPEVILLEAALKDMFSPKNLQSIQDYTTAVVKGGSSIEDYAKAMQKLSGMNPLQKQLQQLLQGASGSQDSFTVLAQQQKQEKLLYEAQVAAINKEVNLTKEGEERKAAILKAMQAAQLQETTQYNLAKKELEVSTAANISDSLVSIAQDLSGKQSGIYKAMFAVSKAFAIADSIVKIQQALATAAASLPFPANLGAIATVAAETASIVSNIMAVGANFDGGGYTGDAPRMGGVDGKGGFLAVMHPQETVTDHTKPGQGAGAPGGVTINVHNYAGAEVSQKTSPDGKTIDFIIKRAEAQIANGVDKGGSPLSLALERSYPMRRGRQT